MSMGYVILHVISYMSVPMLLVTLMRQILILSCEHRYCSLNFKWECFYNLLLLEKVNWHIDVNCCSGLNHLLLIHSYVVKLYKNAEGRNSVDHNTNI